MHTRHFIAQWHQKYMPWSAPKNPRAEEGEQASTLPSAMPENAKSLFKALGN